MKEKMKIKAPIRSFDSAKLQIKAGADELYVGYNLDSFKNITFHGRATKSQWDHEPTCPDINSLKDIIAHAHDHNVVVHLTANMPFWPVSDDMKQMYVDYCGLAVQSGIDGLIIGDIGAMETIQRQKFPVSILTSTFMDCMNEGNVRFLLSLGATRVLLPNQMNVSEMKAITAQFPGLEFEVFGHFGCAHYNGNCFILHGVGKNVNLGLPCRSCYSVSGKGIQEKNYPLLDAGEDCSICQIPSLMDAGIHSLKIVGREMRKEYIASLTRSYRKAIDMFENGESVETVKAKVLAISPFWKNTCLHDRCKYADSKITNAFV